MIKDRFISKDDSTALYGIAILLMVFHHCFCIPSRLNYNYIPILGSFNVEARIAWLGKICVAIFSFVSGYAFSIISDKNMNKNLLPRFKENVMQSLRQLIKLYSKFWLVFIIFVPIGILFYGKSASPKNLVIGLLGGVEYNGEWWYIWQYVEFLALYPFIELVFSVVSKKNIWVAGLSIIVFIIIIRFIGWNTMVGNSIQSGINQLFSVKHGIDKLFSDYLIIFLTAFSVGKLRIFEKIDSLCSIKPVIAALGIVLCFLFRWLYTKKSSQSDCDIIITPFLIYFIVTLLHRRKKDGMIQRILKYLGKNSTFMWLTHTFWIYYYFQNISLLPRYSILIFLWVVILSLITSILLTKIYLLPKKMGLIKK